MRNLVMLEVRIVIVVMSIVITIVISNPNAIIIIIIITTTITVLVHNLVGSCFSRPFNCVSDRIAFPRELDNVLLRERLQIFQSQLSNMLELDQVVLRRRNVLSGEKTFLRVIKTLQCDQ